MSTQKVADKILQDAKDEAKAIAKNYKEQIMKVRKDFAETIAARRKDIETRAEETKRAEITRAVAQEKLRLNKQLIERKQHLINGVVNQALAALNEHKEYENFLKALIKQSTLRTGELHMNDKDWKKFGSTIEKFLKKEQCEYTIVKDNTLSGGVMIQHEKTTHHGSLDLIRELLHEELTITVSKQVL
jgi:vacuolar-type H+-ATPase subunit E/Vma4